MKLHPLAFGLCFVLLIETACGPPPSTGTRSRSNADAGVNGSPDAGPGNDAGAAPAADTGSPVRDAGPPPPPPRDTGPAPCTWPTSNLGNEIGQSLPSHLAWQGLGPGESQERRIGIDEFFDCDGERGIHAVLIITSQYGCSRCTSQADGLTEMLASWRSEGLNILVLTLKLEDPGDQNPASMAAVNHWRDAYGLNTSYVGYDNGYAMVPRSGGGSFGTPLNSIVDPRNMEVIEVIQGYDRSYSALLTLARARAAER
jgi:hypothetical protein